MALCLSVRPSVFCVCLLRVGVVLKRLDIESRKQNHTIAQGVLFSGAKDLSEIPPWSPQIGQLYCVVLVPFAKAAAVVTRPAVVRP